VTNNDLNNLKKAFNKDFNDAQVFIELAKLGVAVKTTGAPTQSGNSKEAIIASLTSLKQRIYVNVEKLMVSIDDAINQLSC